MLLIFFFFFLARSDLVPPGPSHAVRNQGCQCPPGRLFLSPTPSFLGTRCFLPFLVTFPTTTPATETRPPKSSLQPFGSRTESFTGSQTHAGLVQICWWKVKPTTTKKGGGLIGSCEECSSVYTHVGRCSWNSNQVLVSPKTLPSRKALPV